MQSEQVNSSLVYNELQLGQSLNRAVCCGESAKFAYLLSMLSDDVLDQPQFHFASFDRAVEKSSEAQLRQQFCLPPEAPVYCNDEILLRAEDQSRLFALQGSLADVRLLNALAPVSLVAKREDENPLPAELLDIVPHWKRPGAKSVVEYSAIEPMIDLLNQLHPMAQPGV